MRTLGSPSILLVVVGLARLSRNLTNKLIHTPTVAIRNASAEGRTDLLEYLRGLYALPQTDEPDDIGQVVDGIEVNVR